MPVEVGDVFRYSSGVEYTVSDCGPAFVVTCFLCGASAAATADLPMQKVRCGQCWARHHELLPGQRIYEEIVKWQAEHKLKQASR